MHLEQTKDQAAVFLLTYDRDAYQVGLEATHLSEANGGDLSADYDATVAMSAKMPTAYLVHKKTASFSYRIKVL